VTDEKRTFQSKGTEDYFFIHITGAAVCIACNKNTLVLWNTVLRDTKK
jgi:hypothetical protein